MAELTKDIGGRRQDHSCLDRSSAMIVENREYGYRGGYIITPDGAVGLYDQADDPPYTRLDVATGGRSYSVSWDRTFTDRRLKTLARRFAAEVAGREALSQLRKT